jgi:hypothetical protein
MPRIPVGKVDFALTLHNVHCGFNLNDPFEEDNIRHYECQIRITDLGTESREFQALSIVKALLVILNQEYPYSYKINYIPVPVQVEIRNEQVERTESPIYLVISLSLRSLLV